MDIFTRTKNNIKYAYYRKLWDKALTKMKEHEGDADQTEWKKWAKISLKCMNVCVLTPLK